MKETEKYDSKLYKTTKPYHKMSIHELSDHCKICKSLDKMSYNKIKKIENLSDDVLQKKIKHFLERNNKKKTIRKNTQKNKRKEKNTRKKENNNKLTKKHNEKNRKKENNNKLTKKYNEKNRKKNKTKKTNI
jgi:hypothetical protein